MFNPIEIGDRLYAKAWFSATCLITFRILKKDVMTAIVVIKA
jgi:hypothetical protein